MSTARNSHHDAGKDGRRRTIFLSVVASGIVSLFIVGVFDNQQAERSQDNCLIAQDIARALAQEKKEIKEGNEAMDVKIRQQRFEDRYRKGYPPGSRTCEEIFPKRKFVIF